MTTEELRKSILQLAIQGKLVEQNPSDEPASVLLERIRAEKQQLIKDGKIRRDKNESLIYRGDNDSFFERIGKEIRCIDDEIPFEIPDSWELSVLQDLCWLGDGKKIANTNLPNLDAKYLRGKSTPTMLTQGKVVELGSKVILVDGENSGEVFDVNERGYLGSTFKILIMNKSVCEKYLLLMLSFYRQLFKGKKIGAAIPHLNKKLFRESFIGIPPLAEQKRIVERLNELEPLFAEYERLELQESKLEKNFYGDLNKSILQYAIQGKLVAQDPADEPASVLLERIRAEKERLIKDKKIKRDKNESIIYRGDNCSFFERTGKEVKCIDDEIPFEIPDSWEWCRLSTIMSRVTSGSTPTGGKSVYTDNGIKFIRSQNVHNDGLRLSNVAYISNIIHDSKQNSHVKANDLLLNITGASIGRCAIVPSHFDTANINQHILILRLINLELMLFVHLAITSPLVFQQIMTLQVGGTKEGLSAEKANRLLMPIPPLSEQKRIVEKLEQIKQQIK